MPKTYRYGMLRRDYGPRWFHLSMGRNKKSKVLIERYPHLYQDHHYAVANLDAGRWSLFSFHAYFNNENAFGAFFVILGRWGLTFIERDRVAGPGYHEEGFRIKPKIWRIKPV